MAMVLWLLLRTESVAGPAAQPCEPIEQDLQSLDAGDTELALPRLLYQRGFTNEQSPLVPAATWNGVEPLEVEGGTGLRVRAAAGGRLRIAPEGAFPIGRAQRARLSVVAAAPVQVELELWDPTADARMFRLVELDAGEQTVELELAYFRYERGRVPQASRATQWGLRFVDAGELELRTFQLWQDELGVDAELRIEQLAADFDDPRAVAIYRRGPFALLTDEPRLDPQAVLDALERMHAHTRAVLPELPAPASTVPLLVFTDDGSYRRFWTRFSARFGVALAPLEQDEGFTWHGVATAWFSDRYGAVRPTYVHEAHHALLERSYGLAAQRSWLFEGLANLEQLAISRQDLRAVYRRGLRRTDTSATLLELADGEPISTSRYWQATLVCEWLLADASRRAALGSALVEMAERGSTDLRPLAGRHFGAELDALGVELGSWAWLRYGP